MQYLYACFPDEDSHLVLCRVVKAFFSYLSVCFDLRSQRRWSILLQTFCTKMSSAASRYAATLNRWGAKSLNNAHKPQVSIGQRIV